MQASFGARDYLCLFYQRIDRLYAHLPAVLTTHPDDTEAKLTQRLQSMRLLLDPGPNELADTIDGNDPFKQRYLDRLYKAALAAEEESALNRQQWITRREAVHKRQHLLLLEEAHKLQSTEGHKPYHG